MYIMVELNKTSSSIRTKVKRMREELEDLEDELTRCEESNDSYDEEYNSSSRSRSNQYNNDERYHERGEYGRRERSRYRY